MIARDSKSQGTHNPGSYHVSEADEKRHSLIQAMQANDNINNGSIEDGTISVRLNDHIYHVDETSSKAPS